MRKLLPFLPLIFAQSCEFKEKKKDTQLENLNWLIGEWQDTSTAMHFFESWQEENDSTFTGKGFGIEKGDTIFNESLQLIERREKLFYVATVNEHLAGTPTAFEMISDSSQTWVFENLNHDFPQRIIYMHTSENALHARVEGYVNGKLQGEEFRLHRVSK